MNKKWMWLFFSVGIIVFCIVLIKINQVEKVQLVNREGNSYEKAVVEKILTDNLQSDGTRVGYQEVRLRLTSGAFKGSSVIATSASGYLYGATCKPGTKVIVNVSVSEGEKIVTVYNYDRESVIYIFLLLFFVVLALVGGRKGIESAIGLIFTFICIIFLFLPMLYRGYSPFLSAVVVVILTTFVTMVLIGGFTRKTVTAITGTISGVILAGIMAKIFGHFAHINGYNVSDIEELTYMANNTKLQIGGLLFAGVLIASLGAVMDIGMSISSTICEISQRNPSLSRMELFRSGIRVGRDMMGTMSNTLILAFTGGSINILVWIYVYHLSYHQTLNMYSIGIEIMQGLSGSIAIILTVPIVSAIGAFLNGFHDYD
ncbi:YibE/F family protein [Anaeromicropila populeti]|uniref:Uncharacterized membrane protein n=1 Tax=Anaeromicropila populeti TaxID=37658 RepID=A0A1I6HYP3_9FIRM|nr:YibE/F family protein [Anaeromicropila populeti]SFR59563.1 Uncharacterized membrane protein [Anaeromicropila populeti]